MSNDDVSLVYRFECFLPNNRILSLNRNCIFELLEEFPESDDDVTIRYFEPTSGEIVNISPYRLGFHFSRHLKFLHETALKNMLLNSIDAIHDHDISSEIPSKICNGIIHPGLYVKSVSECIGNGLFADSFLFAETFLGEYTGVVKGCSSALEKSAYSLMYPSFDCQYEIDAKEYGSIIRFANHSDSPNAEFRRLKINNLWHVYCVTIQDIQANEEIVVHYGPSYWLLRSHELISA